LLRKEGEDLIKSMHGLSSLSQTHKKSSKSSAFAKKKKKRKKNDTGNMLNESIEIDQETLTKKKQERKQEKPLFENVECENALYCFSKVRPPWFNGLEKQDQDMGV